jgi:transposase
LQQVAGGGEVCPVKSTGFHSQILGVSSPWQIVSVELGTEAKRVVITAEVDRMTQWAHPETKQAASLHRWAERNWRQLDTCQFEAVIKANVPSVKHRDGSIEEIAVPWADRCKRITKLLAEATVIQLQACGNATKVAEVMRPDWQPVNKIMKGHEGDCGAGLAAARRLGHQIRGRSSGPPPDLGWTPAARCWTTTASPR